MHKTGVFQGRNFSLPLGQKTYIMGILNITPDSFSDGGKYFTASDAIAHAKEIERDGAHILDIGAVSTRPFSLPISADEEIERLSCLSEICQTVKIPVSVDTYQPKTAQYALENGASIINDVSGVFSEEIIQLVLQYQCGYILMHRRGNRAEVDAEYSDGVTADVNRFFDDMVNRCRNAGVPLSSLCLDPGYGFSKNNEDNRILLQEAESLNRDGICLLTALSRKRFLGAITGQEKPEERDLASAVAGAIAIQKGSDILRVHDVKSAVIAAKLADAIYR